MSKILKVITISAIGRLRVGEILWDLKVRGFCLRYRYKGGQKRYGIQTRINGRQRFMSIGAHGSPWTVETARSEAKRMLGRIEAGENIAAVRDVAKVTPTVGEAWERFMAEHVRSKLKSRSGDQYEFMGRLHIVPILGKDRIDAIESRDVARVHHSMRKKPVTANRTVAALSKFFSWCERQHLRQRGTNPCVEVDRFKEQSRDRFLTDEEFGRLGDALSAAERKESPWFIAMIRLLILTGARHSEIKTLRWAHVDLQRGLLLLPDSKTGRKAVVLSAAATRVLRDIPCITGNDHVICGNRDGAHLVNALKPWNRLCDAAGLKRLRIHDLRHSFASVAAARGGSLPMIGRLLGHSQPQTTQRYAHLASDPVRNLADTAAAAIDAAMNRNLPNY